MDQTDNRPAPTSRVLVIALIVALGMAAAFAALWLRDRHPSNEEVAAVLRDERREASDVADQAMQALMTYDAASLEDRRAQLNELMTEDLRADYDEIVSGGLDEALQERGATTEADIVTGPDVTFASATQASAVARVIQEISDEQEPGTRTLFYVMRLMLERTDDGWKVNEVDVLSQVSS